MKKTLLFLLLITLFFSSYAQQWNCGDTLLDIRDGKKYTTVLIGSQCWMGQNLNYGTAVSSTIDTVFHSNMFDNGIVEKYAPNGDTLNLPYYGALYEWDEMMQYTPLEGAQGLCPNGWHIPTDAEWNTMLTSISYDANALKDINEGMGSGIGTNTCGFAARAAGDRDSYGIFYGLTLRFIFWTSTQADSLGAYHYTLWAENDTLEHLVTLKNTGLSCRCLKNDNTSTIPNNEGQNDILIYPNPTSDLITLSFNKSSNWSYQLYNSLGKSVISGSAIGSSYFISLTSLPNGFYFITISNDKKEFINRKMIIKK